MVAVIVNALCVVVGSLVGIAFKSKINASMMNNVLRVIGCMTIVIGISSAIKTNETLACIICLAVGTLLGEWLDIEGRIDKFGGILQRKFNKGGDASLFTQAFLAASILHCVGSMSIMGSLEAGINGNYDIIFSKSVMDGISSIVFASTMGIGTIFSALSILIYQGGLTLLSSVVAPFMSAALVTEMSAVGGVMLIAIGLNLAIDAKFKAANMLPSIFLPIIYFLITGMFA